MMGLGGLMLGAIFCLLVALVLIALVVAGFRYVLENRSHGNDGTPPSPIHVTERTGD